MAKIWRYIYIDQIKQEVTEIEGIEHTTITAINRELFQNCPITYNIPEGLCYVHTDEIITGLTLFAENSEMIENRFE